ncbi:SDR family NAD(P)-dependent oxidoreductase [Alteribacter natronophilus]|uniref:SDR family NAD(P)-dependent oxidoreductase n=1 Tax=Alteribacter natronophilus TaxID=2583810 RepID=UPI00110E0933|nr:SDR family NAD(P)-dependent oxidoreductase [Alteribacter natronophilus]TMW73068.1 SDR family oxidoreductase [Alteribacter natronophilus]
MNDKTVLITGTSSGFGMETALLLAEDGYTVIATMRKKVNGTRLRQRARKAGIEKRITVMELDVNVHEQIEKVRNEVLERFGAPDVLINNAGYSLGGITETLTCNDWEQQIGTNVLGVACVTGAFLPSMQKKGGGKIINLGSISGRFGFPALGPYVTSKHALSGYSESLRLELLSQNIYVSLIEAGSYKTAIWEKGMKQAKMDVPEDYEPVLKSMYSLAEHSSKTAADPGDVAKLIGKICRTEKPRFRYQTGKGVRTLIALKALLPWPVIEWFIKRKMK